MKLFDKKYQTSKVASASLESFIQRGIMDERDVDYLNHLEIPELKEEVALEGIIRAAAHDLGSVVTDTYREIKGWLIAIETKRRYISEICDDLIDWLVDKDIDYKNLDLDMGTVKTFMKTSETFYWRFYFLLDNGIYNQMIADIKANKITNLEALYDTDFTKRQSVTKDLDSIDNIKDLIKVVERYKERSNKFFELIIKRKSKIKSFPFQVILLGATDLRRTVKKIVNLAI